MTSEERSALEDLLEECGLVEMATCAVWKTVPFRTTCDNVCRI